MKLSESRVLIIRIKTKKCSYLIIELYIKTESILIVPKCSDDVFSIENLFILKAIARFERKQNSVRKSKYSLTDWLQLKVRLSVIVL